MCLGQRAICPNKQETKETKGPINKTYPPADPGESGCHSYRRSSLRTQRRHTRTQRRSRAHKAPSRSRAHTWWSSDLSVTQSLCSSPYLILLFQFWWSSSHWANCCGFWLINSYQGEKEGWSEGGCDGGGGCCGVWVSNASVEVICQKSNWVGNGGGLWGEGQRYRDTWEVGVKKPGRRKKRRKIWRNADYLR